MSKRLIIGCALMGGRLPAVQSDPISSLRPRLRPNDSLALRYR